MKISVNGKEKTLTPEEEAAFEAFPPHSVESERIAQLQIIEIELTKRYNAMRVDQLLNKKIDSTITPQETTELDNLLGVFEHYIVVKGQVETDPNPASVPTKSGWPE